jgi:Tesmin/TSO1-like CXC domain, cysteine-rich domain
MAITARNPRAFTSAGVGNPTLKLPPGEIACNCVRSRCLKLYCSCFQNGKICNPNVCTCVGCYNTEHDEEGHRTGAIQQYLERRPDAFVGKKPKEIGLGCACKNNRCIRKYCECFRNNIACTSKCTCRLCENGKKHHDVTINSSSAPSWRNEESV